MSDIYDYCKDKALIAFRKAYDLRCELGMGRSGYAAAILLEHLNLFDPANMESFVEYDEY